MQVNLQQSYTSIQAIFAMAQDFYAEGRGAPLGALCPLRKIIGTAMPVRGVY